MATYEVVRFFKDDHPQIVVAEDLTLEEAQEWCNDPETSSKTATGENARRITEQYGEWLDGWRKVDDDE